MAGTWKLCAFSYNLVYTHHRCWILEENIKVWAQGRLRFCIQVEGLNFLPSQLTSPLWGRATEGKNPELRQEWSDTLQTRVLTDFRKMESRWDGIINKGNVEGTETQRSRGNHGSIFLGWEGQVSEGREEWTSHLWPSPLCVRQGFWWCQSHQVKLPPPKLNLIRDHIPLPFTALIQETDPSAPEENMPTSHATHQACPFPHMDSQGSPDTNSTKRGGAKTLFKLKTRLRKKQITQKTEKKKNKKKQRFF